MDIVSEMGCASRCCFENNGMFQVPEPLDNRALRGCSVKDGVLHVPQTADVDGVAGDLQRGRRQRSSMRSVSSSIVRR